MSCRLGFGLPIRVLLCVLPAILMGVTTPGASRDDGYAASPEDASASAVKTRARQVLLAMKRKDAAALASLVHPDKGVRFSPDAFVDVKQDRVLSRQQVRALFTDKRVYLWGYADGTGDPIRLTPAAYFRRWVYDRDYLNAPQVSVNRPIARGNTVDNSRKVYPGATIVEYHFPAKLDGGLDWGSLRLVFERKAGTWYLVGVIHVAWTI